MDKDHRSLLYVLEAISHCSCAWDMVLVVMGRKGDHTDPSDHPYLDSTVQTRLPTSSVSGRNIATPTDPVDRKIAIRCARACCVLSGILVYVSVTIVQGSKHVICRQGVLFAFVNPLTTGDCVMALRSSEDEQEAASCSFKHLPNTGSTYEWHAVHSVGTS